MKPFVNFCLMLHNHQPVGNTDEVIESTFNCAYYPFFDVLERHSNIKVALHFSGIILEWIEKRYPEFLDRIGRAVSRGQVELLTGGFYEPILSLIDPEDAEEQINRLSRKIESRFGVTPAGLWLAERVWDPAVIPILKGCGIDWVVVDENHLVKAGLPRDRIGPVIAEHLGHTVLLVPADKELRYSMPYSTVENTVDYIRSKASFEEGNLLLAADDGEKFGDWPGSFRILYEEGWLNNFFELLQRDSDIFRTVLPSEHLMNHVPRSILRVPPASYEEMLSWSLPVEQAIDISYAREIAGDENIARHISAGYFPGFLTKYPESNFIHKRVLDLSRKIRRYCNEADASVDAAGITAGETDTSVDAAGTNPGEADTSADAAGTNPGEADTSADAAGITPDEVDTFVDAVGAIADETAMNEIQEARTHILAAQCNCAYWHGVFGGIYLPHLRGALHYHYNQAAFRFEKTAKQDFSYFKYDLDADREDEILLSTPELRLTIKERGGALMALDHAGSSLNLLDVLARRVERYHPEMLEGFIKDDEPAADWYPRYSFVDHFFAPSLTLPDLRKSVCAEQGDFIDSLYNSNIRGDDTRHELLLTRHGRVMTSDGLIPVSITKIFAINRLDCRLDVEYRIVSTADNPAEVHFGTELNLALPSVDDERCIIKQPEEIPLSRAGIIEATDSITMAHGTINLDMTLKSDPPANIYHYPVHTSSMYHSKHEKIHQGVCVIPVWHIQLLPGEPVIIGLSLDIT